MIKGNKPVVAAGLVAALLEAEPLFELEGDGRDVTMNPLFFTSRRGCGCCSTEEEESLIIDGEVEEDEDVCVVEDDGGIASD